MPKGEHLKKGYILDRTRNLCDSCKFSYPECDGDCEYGDAIGNDNIIKCKKYRKTDKLFRRIAKGSPYWTFNSDLIPMCRIEEDSALDTTRSLHGNYYYSEEDCLEAIEKVKTKQSKK